MFTHELAWQFHFIDFATVLLERWEERLNEFAGFQLGQHLFSFFSRHVQLTSYLPVREGTGTTAVSIREAIEERIDGIFIDIELLPNS